MSYPNAIISELCDEIVVGHVGPSSGHRKRDGVPFLMGKNVGEGFLKLTSLERVTPEFHKAQRKSQLHPGDIVVVRIGQSGLATKIPDSLGEANCSGLVVIKRPRGVMADYLVHYLNSPTGRRQSLKQTKGSTRQTLNTKSIAATRIPLPSLEEQRRIVDVLDRADALRQKRRLALQKLDTLLQSVFLDMFGDPRTNPRGWELGKLGNVGLLERGKSKHRPRNAPELLGGTHPLIQTGDVASANGYIRRFSQTYSDLGLAQSRKWIAGTLCITIAANIAKTAILTFDACFPDSVVGFTPSEIMTTEYVQYYLTFKQKELEEAAPESAQKNINLKILNSLVLPIPPIELQDKFSRVVEETEKLKIIIGRTDDDLVRLFGSIQKLAFSGDLFSGGSSSLGIAT